MPIYDYRCTDCGHSFVITESLSEHEKAVHRCPSCDSSKVERVITSVNVQTAKKS